MGENRDSYGRDVGFALRVEPLRKRHAARANGAELIENFEKIFFDKIEDKTDKAL